jgi:hypothetical protein
MNAVQLCLILVLACWAFYRLALWEARRGLETALNETLAKRGLRIDPEFAMLLRRPTVDGVARKILQKRGLCAYADIMLRGEAITLVCHDKAHLDLAVKAIEFFRQDVEVRMVIESKAALAGAADGAGQAGFAVIEGGVK